MKGFILVEASCDLGRYGLIPTCIASEKPFTQPLSASESAKPIIRLLFAGFTSLSCIQPQDRHAHSRTNKGRKTNR